MEITVGIDLGTTNCAVARVGKQGRPEILPNRHGERTTPSVVAFRNGEVMVGRAAQELQRIGDPYVAAFFKRQVGVESFVFHDGERDHSAAHLSAFLLEALALDASAAVGVPVKQAVITVPAYFRNPEREATLQAGRSAGLEVLQLINEPTAAAIAYGCHLSGGCRTLLVYDLGGGTFDVTLLRTKRDELRVLGSEGDHELGGKDWDDRIVEFLAARFEEEFGFDPLADLETFGELLMQAEEAKRRLSVMREVELSLTHAGHRGRYRLSRATFEGFTEDLMQRTVGLTGSVLEEHGVQPADLDGVLLVGGSTRMPMVHRFVVESFGKEPLAGVDVDSAVALGAALVAAERAEKRAGSRGPVSLAGRVKTIDVTSHSLGMIAINGDRSAYVNSAIIPKNTEIPGRETRPFQHRTRARGDNVLEIFVTQGESESPSEITYLGRYVVDSIPHAAGGPLVLDIEYSYDHSGTVKVGACVRGSIRPLPVRVEPLPPDVPERFLGPPDAVAEAPHVTAYLAFDLSGSMSGEPLAEAKKAAHGFLHNIDLAHCSVGVISFADSVKVKLQASQNARNIARAIDGLRIGEVGGANNAHPFDEVRRLLAEVGSPKFVITLADGVWSCRKSAVESAQAACAEEIESIAIGFGGADRKFLAQIACSDEASFFTSVSELVTTFTTIAQVLTESQSNQSASERRLGFVGALRHLGMG